jgi:hypothetical protein
MPAAFTAPPIGCLPASGLLATDIFCLRYIRRHLSVHPACGSATASGHRRRPRPDVRSLAARRLSLVDLPTIFLALIALGLLLRFKINSTWLILGGALIGLLRLAFLRRRNRIRDRWHHPLVTPSTASDSLMARRRLSDDFSSARWARKPSGARHSSRMFVPSGAAWRITTARSWIA